MTRDNPPPITDWSKYRTFGLFIAALFSIRFGMIYTPILDRPVRVPPALDNITAILPAATDHWQPVWLLGFIWIALGLGALGAIALPKTQNWLYILTTSFTLYWALAYFTTFMTDDESPAGADIFTGVLLLVPVLWLIFSGLVTRQAKTMLDEPPLRGYREDHGEGHRVE